MLVSSYNTASMPHNKMNGLDTRTFPSPVSQYASTVSRSLDTSAAAPF